MDNLISLERLDGCRAVRLAASQSCFITLQKVLGIEKKVSEVQFRNRWLKEMYRFKNIIPEGWYDPPLFGIGILFADVNNPKRYNYSTLRDKNYWPKADSFFKRDGLGYIFASPFTWIEDTPIIGDFGISFYLGSDIKIIDHFKKSYSMQYSLIDAINIGLTFSQIHKIFTNLMQNMGLVNNVYSTTDKSWTNIGHSIPFIDRNINNEEKNLIMTEDPDKIHKMISQARIFINQSEKLPITDNCAFTVEPRITSSSDPTLPMCSFHTIIQFIDGKKVILTNFDGIFNFLGMDWIKK